MPKRKKKKFLTVYTVSYSENDPVFGVENNVVGSYIRRGDALSECADLILDKLEVFPKMRPLFIEDGDHRAKEVLERYGVGEKDAWSFFGDSLVVGLPMPDSVKKALKPFVRDVLGGDCCYVLKGDGGRMFRFDIDENDVECPAGIQLWTCVTSGVDGDGHDQEFEQAFPEVFMTEEEAVECALDDLRMCLEGHDDASEIMQEASESIEEYGYYEYELNDSTSRRWDIWSTPVDIGQGSGKVQRP